MVRKPFSFLFHLHCFQSMMSVTGLLKRYENMINSTSSSPSIKMSYTFEYVCCLFSLCLVFIFTFSSFQCSDLGDAALPREIYAAIIRLSTEKQYKSIPGYTTHVVLMYILDTHHVFSVDIPVSYLKQSSNNSSSFICM
jgi:hypothetical protein